MRVVDSDLSLPGAELGAAKPEDDVLGLTPRAVAPPEALGDAVPPGAPEVGPGRSPPPEAALEDDQAEELCLL